MMTESSLERAFETLRLQIAPDLPEPEREYRFTDERKWRFDFAYPSAYGGGLAIEIEGGVWQRGRHLTGRGFIADCDKYNAATVAGWRVLRFTGDHLHNDPIAVFALIRHALTPTPKIGINDKATP